MIFTGQRVSHPAFGSGVVLAVFKTRTGTWVCKVAFDADSRNRVVPELDLQTADLVTV
jgi:hypothetical protein